MALRATPGRPSMDSLGPPRGLGGVFTWFGIHLENGDAISIWDTSIRGQAGRMGASSDRTERT